MPKLKIFLPDVNVWLALSSRRHLHSQTAKTWFEEVGEGQAVFCRITQMGLLRLLTNRNAMGVDVIDQARAWAVYQMLAADWRVRYFDEPDGVEGAWRDLTRKPQPAVRLWTDAYLQALAQLWGLQVVSFDRGYQKLAGSNALILE